MSVRSLFLFSLVAVGCSESGLVADSLDPSDPVDPIDDPSDPSDPSDPTDPVDPGEPYANIAQIQRTNAMFNVSPAGWQPNWNSGPDAIGQAFYADHADDYDFLAVYTEEEVVNMYAWAVKYDFSLGGLGDDWPGAPGPDMAGSAGRLDQIDMMTWTGLYAPDPSEVSILVHETTHMWGAFAGVQGAPSITEVGGHWNVYASTGGPSAVGYGDLTDLGNGRFRFDVQYPLQLSPLELYLAGLIPASEVPPMFAVQNPNAFSPSTPMFDNAWGPNSYGEDVEFGGNRVDFTVQDVIAANGPRQPAFGSAPTHFRFAFALVCDGTCADSDLAVVEAQRVAFESAWVQATGGRSTVDTTL